MDNFELLNKKIFKSFNQNLNDIIITWKRNNEKIVFSNGCFDILHLGHIEYLSKASSFGSKMILGLNTDTSVKKLKGENRPINNQDARSKILASLFFVDAIVLFNEETPYNLIQAIKPDILVKGNDYKIEDIVGYDIVINNGGKVQTIELTEGYSSTNLINKLKLS